MLRRLDAERLPGHDRDLRSATLPLVELIAPEHVDALEAQLYGNAYKGVTDVVTKWLWPQPSARLVRCCARLGITPNQVTSLSLLLALAATVTFFHGAFGLGLVCGWLMTLLDTVDGKLARVTLQSSRSGDLFDHGIDLIHPPFWYLAWAVGSASEPELGSLSIGVLAAWIFLPYVLGRLTELSFSLCCGGSLFTFKPFDSWFRLVTARRNPSLLILSLSYLAGHPGAGVAGVIAWAVFSSAVLLLRLFDGLRARRVAGRPLLSWLARDDCRQRHPLSTRLFSTTRGAYIRRIALA